MNNKANMDFNVIKHKSRCLDTMARYFYTNTCRRRFILEYFGEIPNFSVVVIVIIAVKMI